MLASTCGGSRGVSAYTPVLTCMQCRSTRRAGRITCLLAGMEDCGYSQRRDLKKCPSASFQRTPLCSSGSSPPLALQMGIISPRPMQATALAQSWMSPPRPGGRQGQWEMQKLSTFYYSLSGSKVFRLRTGS